MKETVMSSVTLEAAAVTLKSQQQAARVLRPVSKSSSGSRSVPPFHIVQK
jgi:hypothetical protein